MSKNAGTTQTTSTTGIPTEQKPYYDRLFTEAASLYNKPGPGFYPGNTVAPLSSAERQGQEMLLNSADATSNLFRDQVTPAIGTGLNALDVGNNPYIQGAAEAAIEPVFKQLTERALPAIKAGANATGNAGSSRQGIAEGQAIGDATQAASNATASMFGNAYGQGLSSLNSTLGQIPGLVNAYSTPGQVASSVGAQDRSIEQARIDEAISRYNYEQNLPYNKLTEYSNLITTPTGGTSQTTVEGTPADQASQIISMILGGASQVPGIINIFKDIFKGGN